MTSNDQPHDALPAVAAGDAGLSRRKLLQGLGLLGLSTVTGGFVADAASAATKTTKKKVTTTKKGAASTTAAPTSTIAAPTTTAAPMTAEKLLAAAKAEGGFVMYTNQDPAEADRTLALLKDKFGLNPHIERLASKDLNTRYAAEQDAGRVEADIVVTGGFDFTKLGKTKNWWATINDVPQLATFPKKYWDGQVGVIGFLALGITRNINLTKEPGPLKWEDILLPEYKDQIILIDPHTAGGPDYWLYLMRLTYGDDFIRKLGAQKPRFQPSAPAALQACAAGAAKIALPTIATSTVTLGATGAPVVHQLMSPTTGGTTLTAVSAKAKNPASARFMLNFLMTKEGQALINKDGYSPLSGVTGTKPLPEGYEAVDQTEAKAQLPELFKLMGLTY